MSTADGPSPAPRHNPTQTTTQQNGIRGKLYTRTEDVRGQTRQEIQQQYTSSGGTTAAITGTAVAGVGGLAAFRTLSAFRRWLSGLFDSLVLETPSASQIRRGQHWTASYIRNSYETGLRQARSALRTQGYEIDDRRASAVIADTRHQQTLSQLYERGYIDIEDAVDNTVSEVSRTLADGGYIDPDVADGEVNRSDLVGDLNERIRANYGKRLSPLGDSLPVRAANVAAITEYQHAGVEQAGVEPEAESRTDTGDDDDEAAFVTAGDDRVCAECKGIADDNPYSLEDVPLPTVSTHPRCRCMIYPMPVN